MVKEIRIEEFDYNLPDERIPRHPLSQRDSCRLLMSGSHGETEHHVFSELPALLPQGGLLVCNDTRVINARMAFRKSTGSRIEIFLLEPISPSDYVLTFQTRGRCVWNCLVGNLKRWKEGELTMEIQPQGADTPVVLSARRLHPTEGNAHAVEFTWDNPEVTFAGVVEAAGFIPIPPYLKRESESSDSSDYQTVYADVKGSVAAPTAGLHFTPEVFAGLESRGISVEKLTLHVGAGTFQPVKSENIGDHPMHTETFSVSRGLIETLISAKKNGRPVTAVGTTSVRTLESLPYIGQLLMQQAPELHVGQWQAYAPEADSLDTVEALEAILSHMDETGEDSITANTAIMIAPGFRWRITDSMVTNFHQPQSTLLLLVSSFLGQTGSDTESPRWRQLYEEALGMDYRFLSYGDACLLFPMRAIKLPASKSIGARFLVASYFAGSLSRTERFEDCDDLKVIQKALRDLDSSASRPVTLDIHASGTAFRFMAAAAASTPGCDVLLTGTPRLCSRPMTPLLDVLRAAGAEIVAEGENGSGPYRIKGRRLKGGEFGIRGDVSSQFVSALMLAAPSWGGGMTLRFTTPLVSRPYVEMTAAVMRRFGVEVALDEETVTVAPGRYLSPEKFTVEADWSAAGFFYEAASLLKDPVEVSRLESPARSLQGDSATASIFAGLGVASIFHSKGATLENEGSRPGNIEADFSATPDLVPAFAVACCLNGVRFRLTGVHHLRVKESDRLAVMQKELGKLGYLLQTGDDHLAWDGEMCEKESDTVIATYDDHRIAMSFAMAAISLGHIRIADPGVVEKSFAGFWNELPKLGLSVEIENGEATVRRRGL